MKPKIELVDVRLRYDAIGAPSSEDDAGDGGFAVDLKGNGAPPVRMAAGEFSVLLGPSGCGKSSLLRMIAGLVNPTEGQILKDGDPITGAGPDRVMIFQSYTCFPWLTVEQNVRFGLGRRDTSEAEIEETKAMLRRVDLQDASRKYPRELSGGMKQRVAIARALVTKPDVLLMDEPFGALDPHIRLRMQWLMLDLERSTSTTIIFVTHDAREAVLLGDTIYISTLRPCFLKFRIAHPFRKEEIPRQKAIERYPNDFLRFQREVEDRMHFLIEHRDGERVFEADDRSTLHRSTMGLFEEISDVAESLAKE